MTKSRQISRKELITRSSGYYVYTLADPTGKIFYVGKGIKDRIFAHEREASGACICRKCVAIRDIWNSGHDIQRTIVYQTPNEWEAFGREREIIHEIGIESLCNRSRGFDPIPLPKHFIQTYRKYRRIADREWRVLDKSLTFSECVRQEKYCKELEDTLEEWYGDCMKSIEWYYKTCEEMHVKPKPDFDKEFRLPWWIPKRRGCEKRNVAR